MNNLVIENFVELEKRKNKAVRIQFKTRGSLNGIFVFGSDYQEMKKKNFWRIVTESKDGSFADTRDVAASRLFKGDEFTKITDL